jgi:membrane fusion protein (multidrug efflux system)
MQGLLKERVISPAEFDRATAEDRQGEAGVGEIRAAIERKTIRAPFSGILGLRQVNLGQYLSPGDALVTLQSLDPIYVNFGVPQQAAGEMRVGRTVRITVGDRKDAAFTGRVSALDSIVDETTRNVQVQATLANPRGTLRPGMFVQTEVVLGPGRAVISLPASAISYAPYGDSVFVVTDLKGENGQTYRGVRQQFVKLGGTRGDQVAITSGVNAGDEVVTSGVFRLRNGAAVRVNNKVRPANDPAPMPENG